MQNRSVSCSVMSDFCNPMDYSLPCCSVHGISQARILAWVAIPTGVVAKTRSQRIEGGIPCGSDGKESAHQYRRCRFDPWVWKIPWRRKWHSTLVFLPVKSHGQRNLVGYSPCGCKELDMTDWLSMHTSLSSAFPQPPLVSPCMWRTAAQHLGLHLATKFLVTHSFPWTHYGLRGLPLVSSHNILYICDRTCNWRWKWNS